jgi:flavodoxin
MKTIYSMRIKNLLSVLLVVACFCSCSNEKEHKSSKDYPKIPNSILIIYTSGTPYKTLSDLKPEEIDSYSGATPTDMNVEMISQRLVNELRNKHYTVKIVRAPEIESYLEILQYDMVIVGTPTYFWNMHWEIKKMMDIQFGKIYVAKRDAFKNMKHIVFAMSEYGKCAENANQQMKSAINDCSAKLDTSFVFIVKQTLPEYEKQISEMAETTDNIMKAK